MTITFATLLAAAWRQFRRERALLWPLAAAFVFLPALAAMLMTDPVPPLPDAPRDPAAMNAWFEAVTIWAGPNLWWYLAADLAGVYGAAAIALLLLDARRLSVGEALSAAAWRLWPFVVVGVLTSVPVGLGLWLFVLPGLYVQARLIAAVPALAHGSDVGPFEAMRISLRVTRGLGLAITGALVTLFLLQWVVAVPLLSADEWLRAAGQDNPVVLSLVDALMAAAGAIYKTGALLVGVACYRLRASRGI